MLLAAENMVHNLTDNEVAQTEETHLLFFDKVGNAIAQSWNLKDDNLDHQTDDIKQFLIDLLVPQGSASVSESDRQLTSPMNDRAIPS